MFEHHRQPLLPRAAFLLRVARYFGIALGMVLVSLAIGIVGYHVVGGLDCIDATVNAAMILGGMGPVNELHTAAAKLFAAAYALFSGLVFLVSLGVLLAPIAHRFFHRFHMEAGSEGPTGD